MDEAPSTSNGRLTINNSRGNNSGLIDAMIATLSFMELLSRRFWEFGWQLPLGN